MEDKFSVYLTIEELRSQNIRLREKLVAYESQTMAALLVERMIEDGKLSDWEQDIVADLYGPILARTTEQKLADSSARLKYREYYGKWPAYDYE